ncbi:hypothetical protein NOVO_00055 [Rickettsiales bacterium Ac37b]|nr:hypothetical protein NOVO_00055 [Rickettsiales bacterium Ac37b]
MDYSILYITLKNKKFLEIRCDSLPKVNLINNQNNMDEASKE